MNEERVTIGLYRHYQGYYHYVSNISTIISKETGERIELINYFNVCRPEWGLFSKRADEWFATEDSKGVKIIDRPQNITGQSRTYQKIQHLEFQLSSIHTEDLIRELQAREDSPIHELDIEGLRSNSFSKDYVVSYVMPDVERGEVMSGMRIPFDTEEEGKKYVETHMSDKGRKPRLFKRVFIEVK